MTDEYIRISHLYQKERFGEALGLYRSKKRLDAKDNEKHSTRKSNLQQQQHFQDPSFKIYISNVNVTRREMFTIRSDI